MMASGSTAYIDGLDGFAQVVAEFGKNATGLFIAGDRPAVKFLTRLAV